ncbi:MAG: Crp/Fnr family transcriptional regulator [Chloroflexi bacterium]|nr:Crp/Fnr family transcriptional regulator [Chloroflexota bacterium]
MSSEFSLGERLADLPYFRTLQADRLAALAQHATCSEFAPQEVIFWQDDPSAGLWIVERGRVKVFRLNTEGREHILHLFGPGDSFNDIPALDGGTNPASAVALSNVVAWTLETETLLAELCRDAALGVHVITILADRMRKLVDQIDDLTLCSVTVRLARFLIKQTERPAFSGPGITRLVIAAHLATTPETISRALRTLENLGAIRFDRHEVIIERRDLLDTVAMQ